MRRTVRDGGVASGIAIRLKRPSVDRTIVRDPYARCLVRTALDFPVAISAHGSSLFRRDVLHCPENTFSNLASDVHEALKITLPFLASNPLRLT